MDCEKCPDKDTNKCHSCNQLNELISQCKGYCQECKNKATCEAIRQGDSRMSKKEEDTKNIKDPLEEKLKEILEREEQRISGKVTGIKMPSEAAGL